MNRIDNLEALWHTTPMAPLTDAKEIASAASAHRNNGLRKKYMVLLAAVMAAVVEIVVLFSKDVPITTQIGASAGLLACILLGWTNLRSASRFIKFRQASNLEFIQFMEETARNRLRYYSRIQPLGLALCSMSLLAVVYDSVKNNFWAALAAYIIIGSFILTAWFYLRPRIYRKQQTALEHQINKWKQISSQYEN